MAMMMIVVVVALWVMYFRSDVCVIGVFFDVCIDDELIIVRVLTYYLPTNVLTLLTTMIFIHTYIYETHLTRRN